jgi:gas vesicle protein
MQPTARVIAIALRLMPDGRLARTSSGKELQIMDPVFAPVFGALIGALAGIAGALLTTRRQAELERDKWLRGVRDAFANEVRSSVKELTTELASAAHSMCWVCWLAKYGPDRLNREHLDQYDQEMHKLLPQIAGLYAMLAGMDVDLHKRLNSLVERVYQVDAQIGEAGLVFADGRPETASALASHYATSLDLEKELPRVVTEAVRPYAIAPGA